MQPQTFNLLLSMSSIFSTFKVEFLLFLFLAEVLGGGGGLTLERVLWIYKYFFWIRILIRIRGPVNPDPDPYLGGQLITDHRTLIIAIIAKRAKILDPDPDSLEMLELYPDPDFPQHCTWIQKPF
jgi:hypothetical protein